MTTCSDGGLAANRLCRDGYEFEADTTGEAIDGDTLEDALEGEEVALELVAEANTNEHATSAAERANFCEETNIFGLAKLSLSLLHFHRWQSKYQLIGTDISDQRLNTLWSGSPQHQPIPHPMTF